MGNTYILIYRSLRYIFLIFISFLNRLLLVYSKILCKYAFTSSALLATNLFTLHALTRNFFLLLVRQNCVTPERYYGSCVGITFCPQAVEVFQLTDRRTAENYLFALQRSCGTRNINGDPLVRARRGREGDHSSIIALLSFCFYPVQVCCTRPVTNPVTERRPNPFFPTEGPFVQPHPVPTRAPDNPFLQTTTERVITTTTTTDAPVTSASILEQRGPSCRIPPGKLGECVGKLQQVAAVELTQLISLPSSRNLLQTSSSVNPSSTSCLCARAIPSLPGLFRPPI